MKLFTGLLLLLLLVLCCVGVEGSKCKCSRKGPKIRYSDVKKLEMKPKYPHCEEKMVILNFHKHYWISLKFIPPVYDQLFAAYHCQRQRFRLGPRTMECYSFTGITTKSMSRYRGQEHCLHPKLQSTKRFIKWYNAWNEKRRVYEE